MPKSKKPQQKNKKKRNYKSKKRQKYPKANNDINAQNKDMIEMPKKKEMLNMQHMPKDITSPCWPGGGRVAQVVLYRGPPI